MIKKDIFMKCCFLGHDVFHLNHEEAKELIR